MKPRRIEKDSFSRITDSIGNTPLVGLPRIAKGLPATIFAKLESMNPSGSIKDRIALGMIESAELDGTLKAGMTIVEPSSGNTGISLAMVCAMKGYHCAIVMPDSISMEYKKLLGILGGEIIVTPIDRGMKGAVDKARELANKNKGWLYLNQFENRSNPETHKLTTAREIWEDSKGQIDILIAGVGTGGTITGCGEFLKEKKPSITIIAVEPSQSAVLSGGHASHHKIHGIGAGFVPPLLNRAIIDEIIKVTDNDARDMSKKLARVEGILAGISSGAALFATLQVASRKSNDGKTIVVILPDSSQRYITGWMFDEE